MMRVLLPAEMSAVDAHAIGLLGIPGVTLMENAGAAVANRVAERVSSRRSERIVVLCGSGNNGGDGFVVARRLVTQGLPVRVYAFCPRERVVGDALVHLRWLMHSGVEPGFVQSCSPEVSFDIESADIIVDALLGTGAKGKLTSLFADVVTLVNRSGAYVVSVDMPSGIEGATGRVLGTAVRADITVTFAYPKVGQLLYPGRELCGRLETVDIGIPSCSLTQAESVGSMMYLIDDDHVRESLPRRIQPSHKGTYGQLIVIAGSVGMPGAASLACLAALRSGAGTVVAITPRSVQPILHAHIVEIMTVAADESGEGSLAASSLESILRRASEAAAFVIGPGIGRGGEIATVVERLLSRVRCVEPFALSPFSSRD